MYLCWIATVLQNDFKWLQRDKSKSSQFEIVARSLTNFSPCRQNIKETKSFTRFIGDKHWESLPINHETFWRQSNFNFPRAVQ